MPNHIHFCGSTKKLIFVCVCVSPKLDFIKSHIFIFWSADKRWRHLATCTWTLEAFVTGLRPCPLIIVGVQFTWYSSMRAIRWQWFYAPYKRYRTLLFVLFIRSGSKRRFRLLTSVNNSNSFSSLPLWTRSRLSELWTMCPNCQGSQLVGGTTGSPFLGGPPDSAFESPVENCLFTAHRSCRLQTGMTKRWLTPLIGVLIYIPMASTSDQFNLPLWLRSWSSDTSTALKCNKPSLSKCVPAAERKPITCPLTQLLLKRKKNRRGPLVLMLLPFFPPGVPPQLKSKPRDFVLAPQLQLLV